MNKEIILAKGKPAERRVDVSLLNSEIPDMWHLAMNLKDNGDDSAGDAVLKCWHAAHDMADYIRSNS